MASSFDLLSTFDGEPSQFWVKWCTYAKEAFRAEGSCVFLLRPEGEPRVLAQDRPATTLRMVDLHVPTFLGVESTTTAYVDVTTDVIALAVPLKEGPIVWLALLQPAALQLDTTAREVRLIADNYLGRRREARAESQVASLADAMDLGLELGKSDRFHDAALRFCHRLAGMTKAADVALGWKSGTQIKLVANSHGSRSTIGTEAAQALIRVMEEAADQDNEIAHPRLAGSSAINREHAHYSHSHHGASILSLPIRDAQRTVQGVVTLERSLEDGPLRATDLDRLRIAADLTGPHLADLYQASGWWGKRAWRILRRRAAQLVGPEHTGWKLAVVGILVLVAALALIKVDHRVRSPFLLKTEAAAVTTAPFAGFLEAVHYHLGDIVKKDQLLVSLDRRELLLDEANGIASRDRNDREARNQQAQGKLAEALMAKADRQQDDARLAIVQHRLGKTEIKSPFDGIVVEGDLRERLSSPVQTGEPLFKIVQIKDLFGQLQVDERDIGYLRAGLVGELAFASRPDERFQVSVEHFEPVAEIRQEGNVFLLRVHLPADAQADWWRPGMTGLCKITVGQHSLLWVLTHRTIETLRLWLWW